MNIFIINLKKDAKRRAFQEAQLQELNLPFEIVEATTTKDIQNSLSKYQDNWQRRLREVEIACYFSHQKLWEKIAASNKPALILEDDVILCKALPQILVYCNSLKGIDHITLESVGRKKMLSKVSIAVPKSPFKLTRLYIDRNGAGAYILYPSGAKKLLEHEKKYGIALADAQITSCFNLISYQLEPICAVQMDQADKFNLPTPFATSSNIGTIKRPKAPFAKFFSFKKKRITHQIKLALRELRYSKEAKFRRATFKKEEF